MTMVFILPFGLRLRRPRIAPTLALVLAAAATTSTAVTGVLVVRSSFSLAFQSTQQRIRDATQLLAGRLDADVIASLRDPSQVKSPAYDQIHQAMNSALSDIQGARFIYTLRKAKEPVKDPFSRYVFVVDGTPYGNKDFAPIGEVMTTTPSTDALHRVWRTGRFEVDKSFVTDSWGSWLSAYIPLRRRDGSFESVLGIDISAKQVIEERNQILRNFANAYLFSLLLSLPLAVLVGRQISQPLRLMHQRLQSIAQLDFSQINLNPFASQWIREVHQILASLSTVQAALSEFTSYVPTTLVRKLVLNKESLNLQGEIRPLAMMFTDIRNFTALCEGLDPAEILRRLNQYFAVIHEVSLETDGLLDKYIGDSALLFWGAPDSVEHPAQSCVEAALCCRERLDALNETWRQTGVPITFNTIFGIDYGSVVVGNIGPRERVNYTIIGDRVNLTQRLEYSNRLYGSRILASADLIHELDAAADDYLFVKVDDAMLRGFSQPKEVFEVLNWRAKASAEELRFASLLNQAHACLQSGMAFASLAELESLPSEFADRPYVRVVIHKCRAQAGAGV